MKFVEVIQNDEVGGADQRDPLKRKKDLADFCGDGSDVVSALHRDTSRFSSGKKRRADSWKQSPKPIIVKRRQRSEHREQTYKAVDQREAHCLYVIQKRRCQGHHRNARCHTRLGSSWSLSLNVSDTV